MRYAALALLGFAPFLGAQQTEVRTNGDKVESGLKADFNWVIPAGQTVVFDTNSQVIFTGGEFFTFQGGVVFANDITIEPGGRLRPVGPNPLRILATGKVRIGGEIDVSGVDAKNVDTLNMAQTPQLGGKGGPGGGTGGVGSPLTTSSSPRGGDGAGPLGLGLVGGQGGETGYALGNRNWRRPGGGGGGAFGPDKDTGAPGPSAVAPELGLEAQSGFDGFDSTFPEFEEYLPTPVGSFGAESGLIPARGGMVGGSLFADGDAANDFWGTKLLSSGDLVQGELHFLGGGAGGGAGGDALVSDVFPTPVFIESNGTTPSDLKGGGGGGGAGSLHIVSLDEIQLGPMAQILSEGGSGGTGESTFFIDRIGGGGGGGSGGHVILEANRIEIFEPEATTEGKHAVISALGGVGGSGMPIGDNAEGTSEFNEIFLVIDRFINDGGAGGPGVIQLHVPVSSDGSVDRNLILPDGFSLEGLTVPSAEVLLPLFLPQVAE